MAKAVAVVSRSSLRRGQASLYDLIVEKLKADDKITIQEAKEIWLTKVHSDVRDGVPYYFDYYAGGYHDERGEYRYRGAYKPMQDFHVEVTVLNWLMKNIGLLVIRGYLKVIPMVELQSPTLQ